MRFRGLLRKFGFLEAADRQSNNYFLVDAQWQLLLLAIRHVTFDRHTQWLPTSLLMEHAPPISARRTAVLKTSTANQAKSLLTDHNAIIYRLACTLSLNKSKIFSLCVKMFQHQRQEQVPIQISGAYPNIRCLSKYQSGHKTSETTKERKTPELQTMR